MFKAGIDIAYLEHHTTAHPGASSTWSKLQAALGDGLATAVIKTPERRGNSPMVHEINPHAEAKPFDAATVEECFRELVYEWRYGLETIMNGRWDLTDNNYAFVWIAQGMLVIHEDPLGWIVDAAAEAIQAGDPVEDPTWTILMPPVASGQPHRAPPMPLTLPHADIMSKYLSDAATNEGHQEICPLVWEPREPDPAHLDIIGV